MRRRLSLGLLLVLQACHTPTHMAVKLPTRVAGTTAPILAASVAPTPPVLGTRVVAQVGTAADLIGKVKLLSDHGGGVISNNVGNIISEHGGGLVANNAGNIVANNSGGLIGKTKLRTLGLRALQATGDETLLSDARVRVLDATGAMLVDEHGKPLEAVSDGQGQYHLKAVLPDEPLVLHVQLNVGTGGELNAIATRTTHAAGSHTLDLDTASSLGATYVLQKYVKGSKAVLAKLPDDLNTGLVSDLEAARKLLATPPGYSAAAQVAVMEQLRAKAPAVDQRLQAIQAILLAGQVEQGDGLQATQVALAGPFAVTGDAKGNLYVGEVAAGRIRKVDAHGVITRYAGGSTVARGKDGDPALQVSFDGPTQLVTAPDGTIYVADGLAGKVRKITPDGHVFTVAGDGSQLQGATPGKATAVGLWTPVAIALAPDGTLYIGEAPDQEGSQGRVLHLATDGMLNALPDLVPSGQGEHVVGLAVAADGTVYALDGNQSALYAFAGGKWSRVADTPGVQGYSGLCFDTDGTLYFAEDHTGQIMRRAKDGTTTTVAGTGTPGYAGDGGPAARAQLNEPDEVWLGPGHTLYVGDSGNGAVRAIALDTPGQPIRTVAGSTGVTQHGDAVGVAINGPGGLAVGPDGKLLLTEVGSHTIKRLDGHQLSLVVGSTRGYNGEGHLGPDTQIDTPVGLAFDGATLYFLEAQGGRLRRVDADGHVTTVAGNGEKNHVGHPRSWPATTLGIGRGVALAVDPTDHRVYWTDNLNNQLLRLNADGTAEVVAGALDGTAGEAGDGGSPDQALLRSPGGLAFDAKGTLYLADTGNMRIRKLTGLSSGQPRIDAYAGLSQLATFAAMASGSAGPLVDQITTAPMLAPAALCFDPAGNLYESELGTIRLGTFHGLPEGLSLDDIPSLPPRVRVISPDGRIRSVTGPGTKLLADPQAGNALILPVGLAIDPQGRLIVADGGNDCIELLPASGLAP